MITLVIIGVIAAITVPTLIIKHQKEETITRLKKSYSTIAQTTQKAIADNGPIETWEIGEDYSGQAAKDFFEKYLKPYLSISRDCGLGTTSECQYSYRYLNNNDSSSFANYIYRFYLQDGSLIGVFVTNTTRKMAGVFIDINGQSKPNKMGRDLFSFIYYINYPESSLSGKLLPYDNDYSINNLLTCTGSSCCNKNASYAGGSCAAVIMKSGWTIPDGYPW
ncbi:hypothetical protein IKQ26_07855 [bacterium]|nr:hypothetical protein [bacterium]